MKNDLITYRMKLIHALADLNLDLMIEAAKMISNCKGIVWTFGNGQGLAVAEAFALDLVKHSGVRAVSLSSPAMITAYSNDRKFRNVFADPLKQMSSDEDMAIGFTFSGSENILRALESIPEKATCILMTSATHGEQIASMIFNEIKRPICHLFIHSHSDDIQITEDIWSSICHMICNEVKARKSKDSPQIQGS